MRNQYIYTFITQEAAMYRYPVEWIAGGQRGTITLDQACDALPVEDAVALLLPNISKDDFFRGIVMDGVLPRKTFSMGHAQEKRYYLECRRIK